MPSEGKRDCKGPQRHLKDLDLQQEDRVSDWRQDSKVKNIRIKGPMVGVPKTQQEKQEAACKLVSVLTVGATIPLLFCDRLSCLFLPIPALNPTP